MLNHLINNILKLKVNIYFFNCFIFYQKIFIQFGVSWDEIRVYFLFIWWYFYLYLGLMKMNLLMMLFFIQNLAYIFLRYSKVYLTVF